MEFAINFNLATNKAATNKELKTDSRIITKIVAKIEIELHNKIYNSKMFSINKEFLYKLTKMCNNNFKILIDQILSKEDNHKINHRHKTDKQTTE